MAQKLWLPSHFSSGMIFQQQKPLCLHGRAEPGQRVQVSLFREPFDERPITPDDKIYGEVASDTATADAKGEFSFRLPEFKASLDPFSLTLRAGRQKKVFADLLCGELWLTGGQSNMAMPLAATRAQDELRTLANVPHVRVLTQSEDGLDAKTRPDYPYDPQPELCRARWVSGDQKDAIQKVSAVAFQFARELHVDLKIPVGVIETAVGGSMIQSWLSHDAVGKEETVRRHIEATGFYRSRQDYSFGGDLESQQKQPAALFNTKIYPLQGLALRGLIWYQGESDFAYPDYYQKAFSALIETWQDLFTAADTRGLNLLLVQLAPCFYGHRDSSKLARFNEALAWLRRQMTIPAAVLPNYTPAPTFDQALSEWRHPVHPDDKKLLARRLKTLALGLSYGRKQPPAAPECSGMEKVGNKLMLSFDPVGEGLRLAGEGTRLKGFAVCGPDRVFLPAEAKLLYGVRVLVWHGQITDPQAVTYAYTDMNQDANLTSREHIPVVPFRSDQKEAVYAAPAEWLHCEDEKIWACPRTEEPLATGWHEAWRAARGSVEIKVEPANKTEGHASFNLRYRTDADGFFDFEPVLTYASLFPPFDLSGFDRIAVDVFNPDLQNKYLKLILGTAAKRVEMPQRQMVMSALRWQTFEFKLDVMPPKQRAAVHNLIFSFSDRKQKGELYFDHVRLLRPQAKA